MRIRVVFDTNVLFSAIGWRGNPAKCVELVESRQIEGVLCAEILHELAEKLSIKLSFDDNKIHAILGSLLASFDTVVVAGTMRGLQPDPKDDMLLECAIAAGATHLVTGDKRHLLPLKEFRGVKIVRPAELVALVESPQP
jgi:putative PIN family toxin of toxin-antitoxin system